MRSRVLVAVLTPAASRAALAPAVAAARDTGDAVVVTGRVDVQPGERAGTIAVADGNVDVRRGGTVTEDVVVANGDVRVAGRVDGDVVTFAGRVYVLRGG